MSKLHKALQLQHHRHTGKLLHHRHTSYRGLAVVFLLAGGFIAGMGALSHAAADSLLGVYGMVPVSIPAAPAVINTPDDATVTKTAQTLVAGSCPLVSPQVVIALDVDGAQVGTAICDSTNVFSLPVTLTPGVHTLVARVLTITYGKGAPSSPVHITYRPVEAVAASTDPPVLTSDLPFSYLGADRTAIWAGSLASDSGQNDVVVDWGDGSQSDYTVQPGTQQFSHHYDALQSHNVTFYLADASGTALREQFAVAAYTSATPAGSGGTLGAGGRNLPSSSTIIGLYGLFLTVLAVCGIIWLEARHARRHDQPVPV